VNRNLELVIAEYRTLEEQIRAVQDEQSAVFAGLALQKDRRLDDWKLCKSYTKQQESQFVSYLRPVTEQMRAYTEWYTMLSEQLGPLSRAVVNARDGDDEAKWDVAVRLRDEAKLTITDRIPRLLRIMQLLSASVLDLCEFVEQSKESGTE
jgi:hypothetical protein